MRISVTTGTIRTIGRVRTDALIVTMPGGKPGPAARGLDRALGGAIARLAKRGALADKAGSTAVLYPDRIAAERLVLVHLGKPGTVDAERMRLVAANAASAARSSGARNIAFVTDGADLDPVTLGEALAEGSHLGLYRFRRYRSKNGEEADREISRLTILCATAAQAAGVRKGVRTGEHIAASVIMARDMVSTPGADMTPSHIAGIAKGIGRTLGLRVRVLDRAAMRKLGMGALLGVSAGSAQPPKFIVAEYRGGGKKPWIALVGKTITFDSGGISIKPSDGMDKMKSDMAGGAAVLGAVRNAAALRLPLNVVALLPATENMPGGSAYKPGDVLRTMSGRTIEILNTDAEGRLILADALTYACRYTPAAIVDIATLTGACRIALGPEASALLGNNDALKRRVTSAGEETGERVWELPLWDGYCELIKSDIADMKNTGGRNGGVITAACLLSRFVEKFPWAHLDIAATSWAEKDRPYTPKGATAVGVRLLTQFLRQYR